MHFRFLCYRTPIIEKARERVPAFEHVVHRLRHIGVPRQLTSFGSHPLLERCNERCNAGLPDGMPLRRRQAADLALDIEDCVDPAHCLDRQRCFSNIGKHKQLAPTVCPTRRFGVGPGFRPAT